MSDGIEKRAREYWQGAKLGWLEEGNFTEYQTDIIATFKAGVASCAAGPYQKNEGPPNIGTHVIAVYALPRGGRSWVAGMVDGDDDSTFVDNGIDGLAWEEVLEWAEIREPEEKGEG